MVTMEMQKQTSADWLCNLPLQQGLVVTFIVVLRSYLQMISCVFLQFQYGGSIYIREVVKAAYVASSIYLWVKRHQTGSKRT